MKKCVSCLIAVALLFCVAFGTVACKHPESTEQPGITEQPGTNDGETEGPTPSDPDDKDPNTPTPPDPDDKDPNTPTPPDPDDKDPNTPTPPDPDDKDPNTPTPPDPDDKDPNTPTPPDPDDNDPKPPEVPTNPTITGYNCFADGFTFATPFFGEYAYVEKDAEHFWLNKQGQLTACESDLRAATFKQNKYVVCDADSGNRKLVDISGEVLLEGAYTRIEYDGNTVLAFSDGECAVFDLSAATAEPVLLGTDDVEIVADGYLRIDEKETLTDLNNAPWVITFPGITTKYKMITPPQNTPFIVKNKNSYYFVNMDTEEISTGYDYTYLTLLSGGFAVGADDEALHIHNSVGDIVYRHDNPDDQIFDATEKFVLLWCADDDAYFYADIADPLELIPLQYTADYIYIGCVVDNTQKVIYSLKEQKIIAQDFVRAVVGADGFLLETADGWSVMQADGTVLIADVQEAAWNDEILVKLDGEYLYYSAVSSNK